jgi:lambda repressor-like predicted transcriptional regulator
LKTTVTLESKDVREIISKFLGVKIEDVIPNRYSFAIANMSAEEIERRINAKLS